MFFNDMLACNINVHPFAVIFQMQAFPFPFSFFGLKMHFNYEFRTNDKYIIVVVCSTDVKLLITALKHSHWLPHFTSSRRKG